MKKRNHLTSVIFTLILVLPIAVWANHVSIDGTVSLTDQSTAGEQATHYTHLKFDISWENSWRVSEIISGDPPTGDDTPTWDAAWVFAKYNIEGDDPDLGWQHCTLNTSGHTAPSGSVVENPTSDNPQTGVFIYRSGVGNGSNDWDNAKLRWNYGIDGVDDDATVDVKVFAIEMVYIPQGNFYLGDGTSTGTFRIVASNTPVQITTTGVVVKCEGTTYDDAQLEGNGILVDGDGGIDMDGTTAVDNADYPTGYKAFYCMKYEISQGQYADFLNTLTSTQDAARYMTETGYRHGTWGGSQGSRTASVPDRACNYLSWADGAAYSDWAGLRPMTELEFEKACRGKDQSALAGEYAWGNTNIASSPYTLSNNGEYNETVSNAAINPTGNASYSITDGSLNGPLRCGIFATSTSTRAEAGASYYGVMEMSGNLWERPVTLGNSAGRAFTGLNGDGELTTDGNADVTNWPGTGASGAGFRGGGWDYDAASLLVSYRHDAAHTNANRYSNYGFRSARTQ